MSIKLYSYIWTGSNKWVTRLITPTSLTIANTLEKENAVDSAIPSCVLETILNHPQYNCRLRGFQNKLSQEKYCCNTLIIQQSGRCLQEHIVLSNTCFLFCFTWLQFNLLPQVNGPLSIKVVLTKTDPSSTTSKDMHAKCLLSSTFFRLKKLTKTSPLGFLLFDLLTRTPQKESTQDSVEIQVNCSFFYQL
jgi:hypothetical protein